jgi:hypothetical protein
LRLEVRANFIALEGSRSLNGRSHAMSAKLSGSDQSNRDRWKTDAQG